MKLCIVLGTRPEIIRLSAIIRLARSLFEVTLVHTGQNYDYSLNDVFFRDLSIDPPDVYLDCSRSTVGAAVGDVMTKSFDLFGTIKPDALLVLGDTNSCLCTYSAKRLKIPIFHMEAGNRCYDPNVPEEINRRIVDHLADVNLCYMEHARRNLLMENLAPQRIFVVGSPLMEVFQGIQAAVDASDILSRLNIRPSDYFVWSCHREENVDDPRNWGLIMESLEQLALQHASHIIVFPAHPRTHRRLGNTLPPNVVIIEPLGIVDFYQLQRRSICVVSDSGTLTEESNILGFRGVLLRTSTEHPEGVDAGTVVIGNLSWTHLSEAIDTCIRIPRPPALLPEYKDTHVAARVCQIIRGYAPIVNKFVWMK